MVDLVTARRQQWESLRTAAINPPSSSSLLLPPTQEGEGEGVGEGEEGEVEGEVEDMEKMLSELTMISPPTTAPLMEDSLSGQEEEDGASDSLELRRKRLLETSEDTVTPPTATPSVVTAAINIEPPTPTTANETSLVRVSGSVSRDVPSEDGADRFTTTDSLRSCDSELLPSTTGSDHRGDEEKGVTVEGREKSPCFSPASLQNSPRDSSMVCVCVCVCVVCV